MGTSVVKFGSFGFWLNDGHFELLLHLLTKEVDTLASPAEWLLEKRDQWRRESISEAIGCHSAHLDDLTSAQAVADLAEKVYERVEARQESLSYEEGPNRYQGRLTFVGDVPKEWFFQGLEAFIRLLKGELRVTPESFPVLPIIPGCDRWRPGDPNLARLNQLWIELEQEHFRVVPGKSILDRALTRMWESPDPATIAAWRKLTRPENLELLERWKVESPFQLSVPMRMQQGLALRDACEEALRQCRAARKE